MTRIALLTGAVCLAVAAPATAEPVNGRIAYTTFESSADPAAGDIWTMNPDGADKVQAVFDPGYDAQSDWSPDGTRIAFRSRATAGSRSRSSTCACATPPPVARASPTSPRSTDGSQTSMPSWFPDGTGLIYRRTNPPAGVTTLSDVWAMDLDGTNRRPIAVLPGEQLYPSYSPDMKQLVFATDPPGREQRRIDVMDVATGVVKTLFDGGPDDRRCRSRVVAGRPPDRVRERPGRRRRDLRHERRRLERPPDHSQHALGRGSGVVARRHEVRVLARLSATSCSISGR